MSRRRTALLVAALATSGTVAVVVGQLRALGFERSPFVLMTSPFGPHDLHRANALFGYALVLDDGGLVQRALVHKENISALALSRKLVGGDAPISVYDGRALLPFLASSMSWIGGSVRAVLAVNALAWAAAILATFLFARDVSGATAGGVVAAVLAALGTGYWFHALDLSAHLLAFATYVVGGWVVYRTGVWRGPVPLRAHAACLAVLVLATGAYNTGVSLALVYVAVVLAAGNRPTVTTAVAAAALGYPALWVLLLQAADRSGQPVYGNEGRYLAGSLAAWGAAFVDAPGAAVRLLARIVFDFLAVDPPVVALVLVLLALRAPGARTGARTGARHATRTPVGLLLLLVLTPVALSLPWSYTAMARGYLTYCGAVGWHVAAAALLVDLFRTRSRARFAAAGVLGIAVAVQVLLLRVALHGGLAPLKGYFLGGWWDHQLRAALFAPVAMKVTSLTGGPLASVLGGPVVLGRVLPDAWLTPLDTPPSYAHLGRTVAWRTFLATPFLLLAALQGADFRRRRAALVLGVLAALVAAPAILGPLRLAGERIRVALFDGTVNATAAHHLRYDVSLATAAARALRAAAARGAHFELAVGRPADRAASLRLLVDGRAVPLDPGPPPPPPHPPDVWLLPRRVPATAFAAVRPGTTLSFEIDSPGMPIGLLPGYLANTDPRRRLTIDGVSDPTAAPFVPMLEIRAYAASQPTFPILLAY